MIHKRKFKPCIFCGLKDFVIFPKINEEYFAECFGCKVRLGSGKTEEEAARSWNDKIRQLENMMYEKYTAGYEQGKLSEQDSLIL